MAIRTATGIEVEIVALIQRYGNGDARVSIREVGRSHYEITRLSTLQADGGQAELWAAVALRSAKAVERKALKRTATETTKAQQRR